MLISLGDDPYDNISQGARFVFPYRVDEKKGLKFVAKKVTSYRTISMFGEYKIHIFMIEKPLDFLNTVRYGKELVLKDGVTGTVKKYDLIEKNLFIRNFGECEDIEVINENQFSCARGKKTFNFAFGGVNDTDRTLKALENLEPNCKW